MTHEILCVSKKYKTASSSVISKSLLPTPITSIFLSDKIVMLAPNPGHVLKEVPVPFDRPRNRQELFQTDEYVKLRKELVALFYSDEPDKIEEEDNVL